MSLSTEQLLTLNTLMYMVEAPFPSVLDFEGRSVKQLIDTVEPELVSPTKEYDCFITGQEWLLVLQSIQKDALLSRMHIAATHLDHGKGGGGGHSAIFISEQAQEAVFVFKGTQSPEEWADNFAGVNLADTPQQKNALAWYRQSYRHLGLDRYHVTVTGHSKGGNKAKYVSILDSSVDRCVSFDGQGFSDLFIQKYANQINLRQKFVENHSAEYDFVNFLFFNIGSASFYTASHLEGSGFGRNHSPCAMMHFSPDGSFQMRPAPNGQAAGIRAISDFSDDFFSSIDPPRRETSYQTVEAIRSAVFSKGNAAGKDLINIFLPLASHPAHADDLAYLLAYTIKYEQCHPEFIGQLQSLLIHFGLDDFTRYILLADGILNMHLDTPLGILTFESILDDLGNGAQNISPGLLAILIGWSISQGIAITPSQLRELLGILPRVHNYLKILPTSESRYSQAPVQPPLTGDAADLSRLSKSLEFIGSVMGGSAPGSQAAPSASKLRRTGSRLRTIGMVTGHISSALQQFQSEASPQHPDSSDIIDV